MSEVRTQIAWWAGALAIILVAACGSEDKTPAKDAAQVLERWQKAGLEVGEFEPVEVKSLDGAECRRGAVAGVETTLCRFADDDAAKAAAPAGLKLVANTTGAALPRGPLLLVVADRKGADPSGKTINKMTKIFLGR